MRSDRNVRRSVPWCALETERGQVVDDPMEQRMDATDWRAAEESLYARGYAVTAPLLTAEECAQLVALYNDEKRFRSHIIMERYRFGVGDYKYFENPLPPTVASL